MQHNEVHLKLNSNFKGDGGMRIFLISLLCVYLAGCKDTLLPPVQVLMPSYVVSTGPAQLTIEFESSDKTQHDCANLLAGLQGVGLTINVAETSSGGSWFNQANKVDTVWTIKLTKQFDGSSNEMDALVVSFDKCRTGLNSKLKWTVLQNQLS